MSAMKTDLPVLGVDGRKDSMLGDISTAYQYSYGYAYANRYSH